MEEMDNDIERMNWPARSRDMNLIEHLWSLLNQRVAVKEEWEDIPQNFTCSRQLQIVMY